MTSNIKKKSHSENSDAVAVFCRVRPIEDDEETCITVLNNQQVLLKESPEHANAKGNSVLKESTYNFSHVFDQDVSQRRIFDDVAFNLITDLFRGKSSLLMTYGVTSSGKTYTMNGKPSDIGILPRSIDVLFNSVSNYLAHKCVFKPDKFNGFYAQSEADAITERHRIMEKELRGDLKCGIRGGKQEFRKRVSDVRKITEIDEDHVYAVFVSYIEIYNNYIFDLLDDSFENTITGERKSKSLREDANRMMYISGANEIEVDSAEDAFYWLNKGQHRRRLADTALNRESSRSHSIFKIRVVQAPVERDNEPVVDKSCLLVSQLCLVDLAGSERLVRTNATGNQLTEAKNINSSLMVLKNCIDALRENQRDRSCVRIVPYRDSKLTHLLRNYFEGNGLVRMICCVNPHVKEYDENIYVLKFAESCREVEIPRIDENKEKLKKRAHKIFETSLTKLSGGESDAKRRCSWTYANFPFDQLQDTTSDAFYSTLTDYLTEFDATKRQYWEYYESAYEESLEYLERLEETDAEQTTMLKEYEEKLGTKSRQVSNLELRIRSLEKKLSRSETEAKDLKSDLVEKDKLMEKENNESSRTIRELKNKLKFEREMYQKDLASQIRDCNLSWQKRWEIQNAKWRNLREMVNRDGEIFNVHEIDDLLKSPEPIDVDYNNAFANIESIRAAPTVASSKRPISSMEIESVNTNSNDVTMVIQSKTPSSARSTAAQSGASSSKPIRVKQRRSRSAQRWVEHKDPDAVKTGTLFQPSLKHKKTVNAAPTLKDMRHQGSYVLQHQQVDTEGEIETRLYKGDIIPTRSGGSHVEFNDVETLLTRSPHKIESNQNRCCVVNKV